MFRSFTLKTTNLIHSYLCGNPMIGEYRKLLYKSINDVILVKYKQIVRLKPFKPNVVFLQIDLVN